MSLRDVLASELYHPFPVDEYEAADDVLSLPEMKWLQGYMHSKAYMLLHPDVPVTADNIKSLGWPDAIAEWVVGT